MNDWQGSCSCAVQTYQESRVKPACKELTVPYRSVNPATGELLKTFPEHTNEQMWTALSKADNAFRAWSVRPFSERSNAYATNTSNLPGYAFTNWASRVMVTSSPTRTPPVSRAAL